METINITSILTQKEFEVMKLVSIGKYNKEIAEILDCCEATIKKHLQNIFPKLGVNNRTEAAIKFLELFGQKNSPLVKSLY